MTLFPAVDVDWARTSPRSFDTSPLQYYNTRKALFYTSHQGKTALILPGTSYSVARILGENGAVVGAGFLVDARHIFTCAHVVAEALGHSPFWSTCPQELLTLDFPLLPQPTTPRQARVVLWQPVNEDWDGGDIAGLELLDAAPAGAPVAAKQTTPRPPLPR